MAGQNAGSGHAILLETVDVAGCLNVRAVDERDGLEVSFVAAISTPRADIERLAVAKLAYVRNRARREGGRSRRRSGPNASGLIA